MEGISSRLTNTIATNLKALGKQKGSKRKNGKGTQATNSKRTIPKTKKLAKKNNSRTRVTTKHTPWKTIPRNALCRTQKIFIEHIVPHPNVATIIRRITIVMSTGFLYISGPYLCIQHVDCLFVPSLVLYLLIFHAKQ